MFFPSIKQEFQKKSILVYVAVGWLDDYSISIDVPLQQKPRRKKDKNDGLGHGHIEPSITKVDPVRI